RERKTVLMIDEAQHLGIEVLEQIRLLTNLETDEEKLLHIILIGQPELAQKLSRPELRQLNQRITARFNLEPLTVDETGAYIRHRLHIAGMPAGGELFSPSLVRAIHRQSRGVPRLINLLCDRMLLGAYGAGASRMEKSLLRRAAREVTGESVDEWWGARWLLPALAGAALLATALSVWLLRTPAPQQPMPVPAGSAVAARSDRDPPAVPAVLQSSPSVSAEIPAARQYSAAPEAWRRSVREGAVLLAALYGREVGDTPCEIRDPLLRCELAEARSWDQILEEGRPVLLELVDQRRFQGSALFLGIENEQALLATDEGIASASLDLLAGDWTGRFWRYWQPPQSYRRTLQRGSSGEDVRAVSLLFARLDRQSEPLSDALYDARLEERVRLFQTVQGLDADGVLGEQTLKALVLAAGSDLSFTTAAGVIVERSSRGDWP
ncbi:MAG: general secretion pathway protein A, partial [Halieaceae bacterium]